MRSVEQEQARYWPRAAEATPVAPVQISVPWCNVSGFILRHRIVVRIRAALKKSLYYGQRWLAEHLEAFMLYPTVKCKVKKSPAS